MFHSIHTVIVKSTTACNLSCGYCSAHCPGSVEQNISPDLIIRLFYELFEQGYCHNSRAVKLIWHGGEPTLYPAELANHVMKEISNQADSRGIDVSYAIQTNGVFLSPSWEELIIEHNISPGVSIDGPEFIQDQVRKKVSGDGSYHQVMETIEHFRKIGKSPALLTVVDQRHIGQVVPFLEWLEEVDLPIKLNPCYLCNGQSGIIFSQEYFVFLRELYEIALEKHYFGEISPINWMVKHVLFDQVPQECFYRGECQEKYLSIDPTGRLAPCGRLLDNGYFYGIFTGDNLQQLLSHPILPQTPHHANKTTSDQSNGTIYPIDQQNICSALRILEKINIDEYMQGLVDFYQYLKNDGLILLKKGLVAEKDKIRAKIEAAEQKLIEIRSLTNESD